MGREQQVLSAGGRLRAGIWMWLWAGRVSSWVRPWRGMSRAWRRSRRPPGPRIDARCWAGCSRGGRRGESVTET